MSRRGLPLLLSAAMITALLAGCASKENNGQEEPSAGGSSSSPESSAAAPSPSEEKPTEITIMLPLNVAETPPDTIKKELEKLTNTKLTYQFFPADTYEEKLASTLATGSLPDVTYLKNQATFVQMKGAIRDGQFWEIGPYLSEFPNLSKLKPQILDNTKVDGKLYSLYIGRPLARQGLIYRKDWADKLNLKAPETVDEVVAMAKAFTENDPDGNGQPDTIGLTDRNDLIYGAFKTLASWLGTPNNWGEKDGQLQPEFMFPQYVAAMDIMKEIRDAKAMNQDFAATSKTDSVNLLTSGKAGLYIGSMQDIDSLNKDLIKNVPTAVLDTQALIKGPDGKATTWAIPGYNNVLLFPKSAIKDEAELKKVLAFFDKMMTPEVANLMYWGIEGTHYTVVDGKAKVSDDKDLVEREVKGYKDSVIGEAETNGMYESYNTLEGRIHAEEFIIENEKIAIHDPTTALDSETFTERGQELQTLITDATYQYIYGNLDKAGFDKAVEEWKSRGGDKIIEEFNAAYKQ
ncbi:extracellular solute-binding protein [Cohnella lubricantis]|uniref:Extracellular solute-binding protein n=1 Tax=Cohnella lubricantis TaxID=2163172 RepID=A0A841TGT3_9BACL|nr:extracellular solute-binding protein [Cohnella lubricantis]MBB6678157.1 extracellular solute-binding protein [Cohnella lubricantis]MBP2119717.1 putative aldouronate transport system substrate-binding protein [Cohnella lubricantis]